MKFDELSNPLIPSSAAAKPKKSAVRKLCTEGSLQFAIKTEGSRAMKKPPRRQKHVRVSVWKAKMPMATLEDSVIPRIVSTANRASNAMVARKVCRPGMRFFA